MQITIKEMKESHNDKPINKLLEFPAISIELPFTEELVCSYLNYIGLEYKKILFLSWGFSLFPENQENPKQIGCRIDFDKGNYLDLCEKYFGIKLSYKTAFNNKQEVLNILHGELMNGRPVIVTMKSNHLPYHRTYGKIKEGHPHEVLYAGQIQNKVYVMDPGWFDGSFAMDYDEFADGLLYRIGVFESVNSSSVFNIKEALDLIVNKVLSGKNGYTNMFDAIERFADLLENDFDIKAETNAEVYNEETLRWAELITRINWLAGERYAMAEVFKHFYSIEREEAFLKVADQFSEAVKSWTNIKYLIFKSIIRDSKELLGKSAQKIRETANFEWGIFGEIVKLEDSLTPEQSDLRNIVCLDLCKYYNKRLFGTYDDSLDGEFFLIDGMPGNSLIQTDDLKFLFPELSKDQNNVISCMQQSIELPEDYYQSVGLLAFAGDVGYVGDLSVLYEDGSKQEIIIGFNYLADVRPKYGEKIALKGKICGNSFSEDGLIYFDEYMIDSSQIATAIILPDWAKLYIIAISLRKKPIYN